MVLLEDSVVGIEVACQYTNGEAAVVDHGFARHDPLVFGNRESTVGVAAAGLAAPAIATGASRMENMERAERAVEQISRTGSQSKPWARS
jgi:hypothetical protein